MCMRVEICITGSANELLEQRNDTRTWKDLAASSNSMLYRMRSVSMELFLRSLLVHFASALLVRPSSIPFSVLKQENT